MTNARPAIVAVGFDRADALQRLLDSLKQAPCPQGTPLVISLDASGLDGPSRVAEAFDWPFGDKRIIRHEKRLGLRKHIIACGDLTQEYGGIVLFEDDIVAAPHFYDYVLQAIAFYGDTPRVGGIALCNYRLCEFNYFDFEPLDDGYDNYFLQMAASWGQAWTASQWAGFRAWYAEGKDRPITLADRVPRQLMAWRDSSWKRFYIKYLVETDRFFVYPRAALSVNTARSGTNTKRDVSLYQTPLDLRPRQWRFSTLEEARSLYDVFYEPRPEMIQRCHPDFAGLNFDVDLYGTKPAQALTRPLLLSARPCRASRKSFGLLAGGPPAAGVLQDAPGDFISLGSRESFGRMTEGRKIALIRATQLSRLVNRYLFQLIKPLQSELLIFKARCAARKAASRG